MQQVNLIGRVVRPPEEFTQRGIKQYYFVLRAENSPPDDRSSSFDFNVVSSNFIIKDKLRTGVNVYVDGLLRMEYVDGDKARVRTTVKSSYMMILEGGNKMTPDIRQIAGAIRLDTGETGEKNKTD